MNSPIMTGISSKLYDSMFNGVCGEPKCPECKNGMQNGIPHGSPQARCCANCKHIWKVDNLIWTAWKQGIHGNNNCELHKVVVIASSRQRAEELLDSRDFALIPIGIAFDGQVEGVAYESE